MNTYQAALNDLTARVMRGEEYPRKANGRPQVNRLDILSGELSGFDSAELGEIIDRVLRGVGGTLEEQITVFVRKILNGTESHDHRINEMMAEREEVARTIAEEVCI
ncbi:hypothetical protein UFOVP891_13 [uncultured Caudovirales phage]|uniref:Uncharacterized protein n=1 Tax=uncultured Caudovirales phage TaxID=2100421 RepID=A0A6J5T2C2_9CAUD|nr:hypothetical protein UFOVP472_55 [uncultured Caudovirales phage]CAB4168964.1 hypothetical protein UFOVP891_13 [uncultured Caudovirales phage]CAB4180795.1 hypothetical protein UFOVP1053_55 [uncultured Caudovirales phage]CAB4195534.1 hypothetical protein UFOVP1297_19 [uncultured Caudovirales phage]CAB4221923.1 hypothetical protein UFOVP1647_59 [uncultured Caudovirales phage]